MRNGSGWRSIIEMRSCCTSPTSDHTRGSPEASGIATKYTVSPRDPESDRPGSGPARPPDGLERRFQGQRAGEALLGFLPQQGQDGRLQPGGEPWLVL